MFEALLGDKYASKESILSLSALEGHEVGLGKIHLAQTQTLLLIQS